MPAIEGPSALTWNFFSREDEPDLWCAVPAHDSVPRFLLSGEWRFSGFQGHREAPPPGFDRVVALKSEILNGFYLFHFIARASESQV